MCSEMKEFNIENFIMKGIILWKETKCTKLLKM